MSSCVDFQCAWQTEGGLCVNHGIWRTLCYNNSLCCHQYTPGGIFSATFHLANHIPVILFTYYACAYTTCAYTLMLRNITRGSDLYYIYFYAILRTCTTLTCDEGTALTYTCMQLHLLRKHDMCNNCKMNEW